MEAALEYFISLLVTGAYLAKITSAIGMSDTLTGILTSFVSLGFGFQIIAVFLANKRPVKRWVTLLHCLNQLAFALIYFIPLAPISHEMKNFLFVAFLLIGYILVNYIIKCNILRKKTLTEIYYFRAYTLMKHTRKNRDGKYIVAEFSASVSWAEDIDGAISCAVGHHLAERGWILRMENIVKEYIEFWFEHEENWLIQ